MSEELVAFKCLQRIKNVFFNLDKPTLLSEAFSKFFKTSTYILEKCEEIKSLLAILSVSFSEKCD